MVIALLFGVGLCLGSFVNALVWRLHQQSKSKRSKKELSISSGRSMCPECKHVLTAKDLVPVLSWLSLRGKCRYCRNPVSVQYPLVELATATLFVVTYIWWPVPVEGVDIVLFGLWLIILTGLMALLVYDVYWKLLPNRIMYPLTVIALVYAAGTIITDSDPTNALLNTVGAVAAGGGIFYVLFQISKGRWIGGGDVKLGWLLGLVLGTPAGALMMIFIASLLGTAASIPLLARNKLHKGTTIPFGPFLIVGAIITLLFGGQIIDWYQHEILML